MSRPHDFHDFVEIQIEKLSDGYYTSRYRVRCAQHLNGPWGEWGEWSQDLGRFPDPKDAEATGRTQAASLHDRAQFSVTHKGF